MRLSRPVSLLVPATLATLIAAGCRPECTYDTDCPGRTVCREGSCVEWESLNLAAAGRCNTAADCAANEKCRAGWCRLPETEEETEVCSSSFSAECEDGLCMPTGEVTSCEEPPCPLVLGCRPLEGRARPAHSCRENADCSTGWCRDGYCAALCSGDGDCPTGYSCLPEVDQPPWGEHDGVVKLCVPQSQQAVRCDLASFCPEGLTCVYNHPDDEHTRCDEPQGSGAAGARCSPDWCQSDLCVDVELSRSRCSAPCIDTSDCEAGMVCGQINLLGLPGDPVVQACTAPSEPCFLTTDCEYLLEDMACAVRILLGRDHPVFGCRPHDSGRTGAPCSSTSDCTTGLCTPEGVCGQLCDTDTDCRCAYDADCPVCTDGDDCHLPGWYCGTIIYETSLRSYEIRSCRPPG